MSQQIYIMLLTTSRLQKPVVFILVGVSLYFIINQNSHYFITQLINRTPYSYHLTWNSMINNRSQLEYAYIDGIQIKTIIWTYDATGIMKYIKWIATRKLMDIKIVRLDKYCRASETNLIRNRTLSHPFIIVYILPLSFNLINASDCSKAISEIKETILHSINSIYFLRKSIKAMLAYQQLDLTKGKQNLSMISFSNILFEANYVIEAFPNYFKTIPWISWKFIYSENLIQANLIDCEKILTDFMSELGINTTTSIFKDIMEYDSHKFIEDSTWWDQSTVIERLVNRSIPVWSSNFSYIDDFYHLHGAATFTQSLFDNRQCFQQGIFVQMQTETIFNRTSTDHPNRCLKKPFDCAFSDLYSFNDREEIYRDLNNKPIKCGFTMPSIFDKVRDRYRRNHTCQTVIFTSITNCYDPLPKVNGEILPSFCFVAILDTRTMKVYEKMYSKENNFRWDLINLGDSATPFSIAAKTAETLKIVGQRMFPLAKWIIWLDGKGVIKDIGGLLAQAQVPYIGARHPDSQRTSASEVAPTISRLKDRERNNPDRFQQSLLDIQIQENEYKRDGFYNRSDYLKLKMYDIAVFLYRNNHPCISRYLCGWHNEVNYYSYRGQLSVYYSAVRLNLTNYLDFLSNQFYSTTGHHHVC